MGRTATAEGHGPGAWGSLTERGREAALLCPPWDGEQGEESAKHAAASVF